MIIIEGGEKTGKTTLAKELSSFLKLTYIKEKILPPKSYNYYLNKAKNANTNTIIDTFHLSRMVLPY